MSLTCTRCDGTGFLNSDQCPSFPFMDPGEVLKWMAAQSPNHDVKVCDCCGNGESWCGEPGQHYGPDDPQGPNGPYTSNGGLCHCH